MAEQKRFSRIERLQGQPALGGDTLAARALLEQLRELYGGLRLDDRMSVKRALRDWQEEEETR